MLTVSCSWHPCGYVFIVPSALIKSPPHIASCTTFCQLVPGHVHLMTKITKDQPMSVDTALCAWPTCCTLVCDNIHSVWLLTSMPVLQGMQPSRPWSIAWLLAASSPTLTLMTWPSMPWTAFTTSQGSKACCCHPCQLGCIQLCWQSCVMPWRPMTPPCESG